MSKSLNILRLFSCKPFTRNPARTIPRFFFTVMTFMFLFFALTPLPCSGWGPGVHLNIVEDALLGLPPSMAATLRPSLGDLRNGVLYPDLVLQDFDNHYWCPDGSCGNAPDTIASEFSAITSVFGNRSFLRRLACLLSILPVGCSSSSIGTGATGSNESLAFRLGMIAHYVSDINFPYHTVINEGVMEEWHNDLELYTDSTVDALRFVFDGELTDRGDDPAGFARMSAAASHEDYPPIAGPLEELDPVLLSEVLNRRFSQAVNDVVDLWYSLLVRIDY